MATPKSDGSIVLTTQVVTTGIQKGMQVIKNSIKTATVAVTAFSIAIGSVVKQSVAAYAEYEQLVGGVETLFKNSSEKIKKYANDAYKTAGLSANEYMRNVTAFSASLLNSLGNDTDKAAEVANDAIIAISDNVNKMGSDYQSVQLAFQGFAKQQYMLLDNLKLGYGGTKTEMERLLRDAEAYRRSMGETVDYEITNLADVYTAIGDIQKKLGIAGTTAIEAEKTISGSAASMKAAWENVLTAISGGGEIDQAIEQLVESIEKYFNNILPVVERALVGVGTVIQRVAPKLVQTVAKAFIDALPQLVAAVGQMIIGLVRGIGQAITELLSGKGRSNNILQQQAATIQESADNQKQLTENIKETNKELNKSVAEFDTLQILTSQSAQELDISDNSSAQGMAGIFPSTTEKVDGSHLVKEADETFYKILGIVSDCLMALGCILLMTGNIGWGVGLIIAGAIGSEYEEAQIGDGSSVQELVSKISKMIAIAGIAAIVLGILLCYAHMWGIGIKLILIGATSEVTAIAFNWNSIKELLTDEKTSKWIAVAGALAIVLGVLLCFAHQWALGIGLIVVGAATYAEVVITNWGAIKEKIDNFFEETQIDKAASATILVIGIILAASGANILLGLGLMSAGAVYLGKEVKENWDYLPDKTKGVVNTVLALGTALSFVLGVILLCTGVAAPLGIGLILAGGLGTALLVYLNWDYIVEKIQETWNKVKTLWNTQIAYVFTAEWWGYIGATCINGFISKFEEGINFVIAIFETMINSITNKLAEIGFGTAVDVSLPRLTIPRVPVPDISNLPKFMTGSVVPTKVSETQRLNDILYQETDLFKKSFGNGYSVSNAFDGGSAKVVIELDGRELGRAVANVSGSESRRAGITLVHGGVSGKW